MEAAVVVPWRPGCPHREHAWQWVKNRYVDAGFEVIEGTCPDGPWIKALAVQDAIDRTTADILIVADADVWCDHLDEPLARAAERPVVIPHSKVKRLTQQGTADYIAGHRHPQIAEEHRGQAGGGITILQRDVWEQVPLDPRFIGWGQEDSAWSFALAAITGKVCRFTFPLIHLWHPPQPRASRSTGTAEGRALEARYIAARHNPRLMGELLAEARDALRRSPCR